MLEGTTYDNVLGEIRGFTKAPLPIFTLSTIILHVELLKTMYRIYITQLISKNQAFALSKCF